MFYYLTTLKKSASKSGISHFPEFNHFIPRGSRNVTKAQSTQSAAFHSDQRVGPSGPVRSGLIWDVISLRQASELHPPEDAAGCRGSAAGVGGGGAGLQIHLSSEKRQHPRGELQRSQVHPHHDMWRPVLPRGDGGFKTTLFTHFCSQTCSITLMQVFTVNTFGVSQSIFIYFLNWVKFWKLPTAERWRWMLMFFPLCLC